MRPVQESRTQQALNTIRTLYRVPSESVEKPPPMRNKNIGERRKLDKRVYLPAITSILILVMVLPSFTPAMAQELVARALPTLQVTTIPEDDEVRQTGVIVLGLTPSPGWPKLSDAWCNANPGKCIKKESQYKILVTFNGVPVNFNVACQFIKKEKIHPLEKPQFTQEVLRTVLTDESANFVCKLRPGKPGVGVLDVYYVGPQEKQFMADYVMVVSVWETFGRTVVYGLDMQDICVIGWAVSTNTMWFTKPDGTIYVSWPDPLGQLWTGWSSFHSCEDLALWQRADQGLPLSYD
jgi:hypothetical protein